MFQGSKLQQEMIVDVKNFHPHDRSILEKMDFEKLLCYTHPLYREDYQKSFKKIKINDEQGNEASV